MAGWLKVVESIHLGERACDGARYCRPEKIRPILMTLTSRGFRIPQAQ
jgi:hypothetical protein